MGRHAVRLFQDIGGKVQSVSCWDQKDHASHCYRKESGLDYEELASITDVFGEIDREKAESFGYEVHPGEAWLEV